MQENTTPINIEEIMKEIKEDIKRRGLTDDLLTFEDVKIPKEEICDFSNEPFHAKILIDENMVMNRTYQVSIWHPVYGNPINRLIKKIIRKLIRPIMTPVIESQTMFNASTVRTTNEIRNYIFENEIKSQQLSQRIDELQEKVDKLTLENSQLKLEYNKIRKS